MEVTKTKDFTIAYLINERKLRELTSIINDVSDDIEYTVSCIDGTSFKFNDLDRLLSHPNRKEKQYERIEIRNSHKSTVNISIILSTRGSDSITYRVSGGEKDVDHYSAKIEGFIMSLKQWYSPLGTRNLPLFISTLIIIQISLFFLLSSIVESLIAIFSSYLLTLLVSYIYEEKIKSKLFPIAIFELGDGIERASMNKQGRNIVLITIILGAILAYLVNQVPNITEL